MPCSKPLKKLFDYCVSSIWQSSSKIARHAAIHEAFFNFLLNLMNSRRRLPKCGQNAANENASDWSCLCKLRTRCFCFSMSPVRTKWCLGIGTGEHLHQEEQRQPSRNMQIYKCGSNTKGKPTVKVNLHGKQIEFKAIGYRWKSANRFDGVYSLPCFTMSACFPPPVRWGLLDFMLATSPRPSSPPPPPLPASDGSVPHTGPQVQAPHGPPMAVFTQTSNRAPDGTLRIYAR